MLKSKSHYAASEVVAVQAVVADCSVVLKKLASKQSDPRSLSSAAI